MTKLFDLRRLLAIVLAGIVGTVANSVAVALAVGADFVALSLVPGRYGVAIALCLALPLLAQRLERTWFFVLGTLWLMVSASVLAKLVFALDAPWLLVLALNLVYAVAAIIAYRLIAGRPAESLAGD